MTIRAFFDKWIDDALTLFPNGPLFPAGVLYPTAVSDPKEVPLNEDGTVTVEQSFAYPEDVDPALLRKAVDEYLETLKTKGTITSYEVVLRQEFLVTQNKV